MKPPTLIVIVLLLAFAGCGSQGPEDLADRVQSEWDANLVNTGVSTPVEDIEYVECVPGREQFFDGWCFATMERVTYEEGETPIKVAIPYKGDELLWGEAAHASN